MRFSFFQFTYWQLLIINNYSCIQLYFISLVYDIDNITLD